MCIGYLKTVASKEFDIDLRIKRDMDWKLNFSINVDCNVCMYI